jgi:multiple sugar transport system permease protein
VLDLVYVLTGGGPGTATEPVSLLALGALVRDLRFGYGAAVSVAIFVIAGALALVYLRLLSTRGKAAAA